MKFFIESITDGSRLTISPLVSMIRTLIETDIFFNNSILKNEIINNFITLFFKLLRIFQSHKKLVDNLFNEFQVMTG